MFKPSKRTSSLRQSGIRAASARCNASGGVNLGQGICDMSVDERVKQGAIQAIQSDKSLYSPNMGLLELRQAIAHKYQRFNKIDANPETEIMVSHGSTGAFVCAVTTLFNPGDEVILFEPFYGYHKHVLELLGVSVKSVPISMIDFSIDWKKLNESVTLNTKGLVVCTPCNPSGKVFTKQELMTIGEFAAKHDLTVITDEIYEYITYPGYEHISLASLSDFYARTVTISGFSKTYNMTGWRLGTVVASAEIIERMSLVQDYLYVCPVTPLQHAVLESLALPEQYYVDMRDSYLRKRDSLCQCLQELGFRFPIPQGAYYVISDVRGVGFENDEQAAEALFTEANIAIVTGRSFYSEPYRGQHLIRWCYALEENVINQAISQLKKANFTDFLEHLT